MWPPRYDHQEIWKLEVRDWRFEETSSNTSALKLNRLAANLSNSCRKASSAGEAVMLVFTSHESPITSRRFFPTFWESFMVKPNERLVRVSYVHCCTSTSRLSRS